ncbi:MAG: hypothetical protein ACQKBT_00875 [Puniceicoccales bacterium]
MKTRTILVALLALGLLGGLAAVNLNFQFAEKPMFLVSEGCDEDDDDNDDGPGPGPGDAMPSEILA